MSQWVVQRDPRFFDRPDEFIIDRWQNDAAARLPRFAFFPFGGGPRLCLGFAFAETMLRVTLAEVLSRVHLVPDPDPTRTEWDAATLRPKHGIWMTAIPR
jgi:cytochrome P450